MAKSHSFTVHGCAVNSASRCLYSLLTTHYSLSRGGWEHHPHFGALARRRDYLNVSSQDRDPLFHSDQAKASGPLGKTSSGRDVEPASVVADQQDQPGSFALELYF